MSQWVDNLQNFNTKIEIDKKYLKSVFEKALEEAAPRLKNNFIFPPLETWTVRRDPNGGILVNNDRNTVDVIVQLLIPSNNSQTLGMTNLTLKFYEKKFKYTTLYGLNEELEESPDFLLPKDDFKDKYSYSKKSIPSRNYSILQNDNNFRYAKEYKHLNMYLNQIFNTYCSIFDSNGLSYTIAPNRSFQQDIDSPLAKEIILLNSGGDEFISISLNLKKELRLVNNLFIYDYIIKVNFSRIVENKKGVFVYSNNTDTKHTYREPIKHNNRFDLLFLNNLETPNYYFFIASPRGLVKMNKNILKDSILTMFTHYIIGPILKEANMEVDINDVSKNLSDYLQMYEMIQY